MIPDFTRKVAVREAAFMLAASAILAVLYNLLSPHRIAWIAPARTLAYAADTSNAAEVVLPSISFGDGEAVVHAESGPRLLTLEQAHQLHRRHQAVFVDAREAEWYDAGHIAGAVLLSYYAPDTWDTVLATLPKDATLVAYCDEDCDSARRLAEVLISRGYQQVLVLDRGYDSWVNAGLPVAAATP